MTDDGCIPLTESATNDTRTLEDRIERVRLILTHDNFASATDINDFETIACLAKLGAGLEEMWACVMGCTSLDDYCGHISK